MEAKRQPGACTGGRRRPRRAWTCAARLDWGVARTARPHASAASKGGAGTQRDPTLSAPGRVEQDGVSRWKHCHDDGPGVSGPKTDRSKRGHAAFGVRWPCLYSWGRLHRLTTDCGGIVQALDFQKSTPAGKAGLRPHQASRCKRQYRPMIGLSGLRPTPWRRRRRSCARPSLGLDEPHGGC